MAKNLAMQLDSEKDSISNLGRSTSPGKPHSLLPRFVRHSSRDNRLLPGDWVRVKSYREIERTLDDEGAFDGPRIYPSGAYISQTAGHGDLTLASQQRNPQSSNLVRLGITDLADGEDAVRKAVRNNLAEGASQIKIMMGGGISSEKGPLFA